MLVSDEIVCELLSFDRETSRKTVVTSYLSQQMWIIVALGVIIINPQVVLMWLE